MPETSKNRIFLELITFIWMFYLPCIVNTRQLEWLTLPPRIVIADIDQFYTIGCRITFDNSIDHNEDLNVDDINLWAVVSKVQLSVELIPSNHSVVLAIIYFSINHLVAKNVLKLFALNMVKNIQSVMKYDFIFMQF